MVSQQQYYTQAPFYHQHHNNNMVLEAILASTLQEAWKHCSVPYNITLLATQAMVILVEFWRVSTL
jgi:hypothetical protein